MISDLTRSLGLAGLSIFFLLGAALCSLRLGAVSILPNVLPLAGTAALLYWTGRSLQYNTVAVGLGIAVDDTIHFLMAYQRLGGDGARLPPRGHTRRRVD